MNLRAALGLISLLLALPLSESEVRADGGGPTSNIAQALGSEIELFAGCDKPTRKPKLLASPGGTVRQIAMLCKDGGTVEAFLSYQVDGAGKNEILKEAFFSAKDDGAAVTLARLAKEVATSNLATQQLAFVKGRSPDSLSELTVSFQGFSWDLLSGATYARSEEHTSELQSH